MQLWQTIVSSWQENKKKCPAAVTKGTSTKHTASELHCRIFLSEFPLFAQDARF
jgi:hypothetical protein